MAARTSRWRNRLLLALAAIAVIALVAWGLRPSPVIVETREVKRGEVVVTVLEDGRTRYADVYVVSAPIAGNLQRIELKAGDVVVAGATVARITPTEAPLLDPVARAETEARLRAAEASVGRAGADVKAAEATSDEKATEADRMEKLLAAAAVSRQDRDRAVSEARIATQQLASARFAADVARHEVETLRALLGRPQGATEGFDVVSPVNGVVLRVRQESEGPVVQGGPLLEIGDPSKLEVVVDVLSADAVRIAPDAPVKIERWGGPEALDGHVDHVEPSGVTKVSALGVEEQRVDVIIHLDTPRERWATLGDAYRVEGRIEIARADDVLVVPEGALFRREGRHAVFRVEDGRAREVPVELGLRSGVVAEVVSGLEKGDVVVVNPSDNVRDDVRVKAP